MPDTGKGNPRHSVPAGRQAAAPLELGSRVPWVAPVLLHTGNGVLAGHRRYLLAGQAEADDQQVHKVSRERLGRDGGLPSVRLHAFPGARPEHVLCDGELVTEDVAPDVVAVGAAIRRVGDPSPQDPAVVDPKLKRHGVVPARLPARVAY